MTLTRDELRGLVENRVPGPCVSLFMPCEVAGPQVRQNPIRLKDGIADAANRLEKLGVRGPERDDLLAPVRALVETEDFWRERSRGLAIFLAKGMLLVDRLPEPVLQLAYVGPRFHLKPVLPLLTGDGRYAILAISQKHVRGFVATRETIDEIELPGVPHRLEDAVGTDWEQDMVQSHTGTAKTRQGRGRAIFHGHGGGGDDAEWKAELVHFIERIDAGLRKALPRWGEPLVLAATEEVVGSFRATSKYPSLVEGAAVGNPDGWNEKEMHERTWPLVQPLFLESRRRAAEKFPELKAHGRGSDDLRTVLLAASEGRVAELFIALEASCWGRFDATARKVEIHREAQPDDQDLVDETAVQTLLHDGVVYCVEGEAIPGAGPVAANFRYPLHERTGKERDPGDQPAARRAARASRA
ncbi:MAG: hypothetical protein ACREQJ_09265 [Candidatus Binatia bacterium]